MNPPKFNHDQTVYVVFDPEQPEYKSFPVGRIEFGRDEQGWVYYNKAHMFDRNPVPYWEYELTDQEPTIEEKVLASLYENFMSRDNDDWDEAWIPRDVFEWLVIKAGYWRDEYKTSLDTED